MAQVLRARKVQRVVAFTVKVKREEQKEYAAITSLAPKNRLAGAPRGGNETERQIVRKFVKARERENGKKGLRDAYEHGDVRDTEEWRDESSEERTRNERRRTKGAWVRGGGQLPRRGRVCTRKKKKKKEKERKTRERARRIAMLRETFAALEKAALRRAARGPARVRRHDEEATYVENGDPLLQF